MALVSVPKHEVIMRQGVPPCIRVYRTGRRLQSGSLHATLLLLLLRGR